MLPKLTKETVDRIYTNMPYPIPVLYQSCIDLVPVLYQLTKCVPGIKITYSEINGRKYFNVATYYSIITLKISKTSIEIK